MFFSTNSRGFEFDMASVPAGFGAHEISHRSVPEDFRNRKIHRCWRLAEGWKEKPRGARSATDEAERARPESAGNA